MKAGIGSVGLEKRGFVNNGWVKKFGWCQGQVDLVNKGWVKKLGWCQGHADLVEGDSGVRISAGGGIQISLKFSIDGPPVFQREI